MKSSLKDQPLPDGKTSFCNKDFTLVNQRSPQNLENILSQLAKEGPMLGTQMRNFGKRKFGNPPFLKGNLSTSKEHIGLPLGANSPQSIYQTYPNIFKQGQALPQPYGPVDNLRMQSLYEIHGFGRRRSRHSRSRHSHSHRCKSCGRRRKSRGHKSKHRHKLKHSHRISKKRVIRRRSRAFGTPGTNYWKAAAEGRNSLSNYMNRQANVDVLKAAKGWTLPNAGGNGNGIQLYMNNHSGTTPNLIGMPNLPGQYSNNQLNSPVFKFGKKGRSKSKSKHRPCLTKRKSMRRFGPLVPNVAGPNVVGYEQPIPIYHAGGNTINFATNKNFNPDIVGDIGRVQSDGITPRAWLTQSIGIGDGLGTKNRFGSNVYTQNGITSGSGHNVIMQPKPDYMNDDNIVQGNYVGFGKNSKPKSKSKSKPKHKRLTARFGGSTIILNSSGKVSITPDPKM